MTINVKWANDEKTLFIMQREAGWTWEEFDKANAESNLTIKGINHQVDFIVDGDDRLPAGFPIPHFRQAMRTKPDNVRYLIIVLSNPFGRTIFNAMSQLNNRNNRRAGRMIAASSSAEAMALVSAPV